MRIPIPVADDEVLDVLSFQFFRILLSLLPIIDAAHRKPPTRSFTTLKGPDSESEAVYDVWSTFNTPPRSFSVIILVHTEVQ